MGLVASAQMAQDQFLFNQINDMTKQNYHVDKKTLTMNVVATLRDDLRDLCDQQYASLETTMLLSTLVLEFGLGFVVEGTFPHQEIYNSDDWEWYTPPLLIYSALMGLSIVLPFWSIWASIECTRQLNQFMKRVLLIDPAMRVDLDTMIRHYKEFEIFWQEKCRWLYGVTMKCFWLGMISNITAVGILTTMNFYHDYDYPWAWRLFGGMISLNMVLVFILYMKSVCRSCTTRGMSFRSKLADPNSIKEPLLQESKDELGSWWWVSSFFQTSRVQLIKQESSSLHGREIPSEAITPINSNHSISPIPEYEDEFFQSAETDEDYRTLPQAFANRFMQKHSSTRSRGYNDSPYS